MAESKKGSSREVLKNPSVLTKMQICAVLDRLGIARPSKTATKKALVECFRKSAKIIEEREDDVSAILTEKRGRARGRQRRASEKQPHAKRKEVLPDQDSHKRSKLSVSHQPAARDLEDETGSKAKRPRAEKEKVREMAAAQSRHAAHGASADRKINEEPRRRPVRRAQLLQSSFSRQSPSSSKAHKGTRSESRGAKVGEAKERREAEKEEVAPKNKEAGGEKGLRTRIERNWSLIYIVSAISLVLWFTGYLYVTIGREQKLRQQAVGKGRGFGGREGKDNFSTLKERGQQVKDKGRVGGTEEARDERAAKELKDEEDRAEEKRGAEEELKKKEEREQAAREQEKKEAEARQLELARKRQEDERRRVVKKKAKEKEIAEERKRQAEAAKSRPSEEKKKKQRTAFAILRTVFAIVKTLVYVLVASFIILSLIIYVLHKRYLRQKKISEYTSYMISHLKKKAKCSLPLDTISELREEFRGLSRSEWNAVTRGIRLDSNIRETTLLRCAREEKAWEWYGP